MQTFQFRLERILQWRRTRLAIEQQKLDRLVAESRRLDGEADRLRGEMKLEIAQLVTGVELAAFSRFRDRLTRSIEELGEQSARCRQEIGLQQNAVRLAQREVELLERLRERARVEWKQEQDREIEAFAGESYLARWSSAQSRR